VLLAYKETYNNHLFASFVADPVLHPTQHRRDLEHDDLLPDPAVSDAHAHPATHITSDPPPFSPRVQERARIGIDRPAAKTPNDPEASSIILSRPVQLWIEREREGSEAEVEIGRAEWVLRTSTSDPSSRSEQYGVYEDDVDR
jgi:hypothetical protein